MIKLTLQDHEGRRQHHWGVLYRSIFAIVTVMAIPYFLSRDGGANEPKIYLIGFPILSFLLCVISCFVQGDLNKRQQDVLADMRILVRSLSDNYRSNHFPPEGPYHRTFLSVRQWVFLTYIILALLSVVELILILMKKF